MLTKFLSENPKRRDHLEDTFVNRKILECIFGKLCGKVWTGCIWLRIGASGGPL
jgi:hypothetical protein